MANLISRHGRHFTFTAIVYCMMLLIFTVFTIAFPASYFFIHLEYQQGQVDSEGDVNADFITEKLEENPGWRITNAGLSRFVTEDVVFKSADWSEARVIVAANGKQVFAKFPKHPLAWPVVSHRAPIKADDETVGYFYIARSLANIAYETCAIFLVSLFGSALLVYALNRFVLRRLRLLEENLSHRARFDVLTELPNRREVIEELQRRLARNKQCLTAVFFIDLDKFKAVNDSFGHAVGDEVLKASATRMRSCIRDEDFLGRLSGDEFIILLSLNDGGAVLNRISESICNAFSLPQVCLGHEVAITVTVGIALAPDHGDQAEQLIQRADTAMYAQKSTRNSGWKVYHPAMTDKVNHEVHLRARLKQALQRQEFELHYQPLVRLLDDKVIGAEALIRWRDSETGALVSPLDFISELEYSGLIVPVGEWVLRTACRQVMAWRKTLPNFHIAVNVSARQFIEHDFVDSVAHILREEKVAPGAIEIELTESMLFDEELTNSKLAQLKHIGVRLALDDFGTGFSSLGRLASMPFDVIKIDRQFVGKMNAGERERLVIVSIIALGHGLGMTVLSEGIELAVQRQALVDLGCERGQGFLFSRPIPAETFYANYVDCERPLLADGGVVADAQK
jgi:diguanylate cyclase (GGDEF)-like protein